MKFTLMTVWLSALALAFLSLGNAATAQDTGKAAVVDMNIIMKEYYKAKESRAKLDVTSQQYQKEQSEKQAAVTAIQTEGQNLMDQMKDPAISDAKKKEKDSQLKAKADEMQIKQRELMAFAQTASKILQDKQQRLFAEVMEDVDKIVSQVAKNKYTMVFVKPQVQPNPGALIFSEGLDDVTQQVLGILNKDAPAAKKEEKK
jgi:Skp family chaperone for outer membrane proteins